MHIYVYIYVYMYFCMYNMYNIILLQALLFVYVYTLYVCATVLQGIWMPR